MNRKSRREYSQGFRFKSQNSQQQHMIAIFKDFIRMDKEDKKQNFNNMMVKIEKLGDRSKTYFTITSIMLNEASKFTGDKNG